MRTQLCEDVGVLIRNKSTIRYSQTIPAVLTLAFVTTALPSLEALTIILETFTFQTFAAHFLSGINTLRTRIFRFTTIITVGARTFNSTNLSM